MNKYGDQALEHWRTFLPTRFAAIEDPETYFTDWGEEIGSQIIELADQLAGPTPAGEEFMQRVGRLNMARMQAEEKVLTEQVLLPAEPGSPMDEDSDQAPTDL